MKKYFTLLLIALTFTAFSIISCDQDSDVSDRPGGTPSTPSVPTLTITPSGNVSMTVDETKDFTITLSSSSITNVLDLTWDVSGDTDILSFDISDLIPAGKLKVTAMKAGTVILKVWLSQDPTVNKMVTVTVSAKGDNGDDSSSNEDSSSSNDDSSYDDSSSIIDSSSNDDSSYDDSSSVIDSSSGDDNSSYDDSSSISDSSSSDDGHDSKTTTLNVTVDVTIDTAIEEFANKTLDNISSVMLYYGFGNYTEGMTLTEKFNLSASDIQINKTTNKVGSITFKIEDDKLSGSQAPYFKIIIMDGETILANMKDVYSEESAYQKGGTYSITLIADSAYGNFDISLRDE